MKKTMKQMAFTLAETLIVMGVIGVVAALTIPSLTNSTNEKDTVTKVRKVHAALEDAFGRMIATSGEFETWGSDLNTTFGPRLISSMKITKNCQSGSSEKCFDNDSTTKDFTTAGAAGSNINGSTSIYKFIMADGAAAALNVSDNNCVTSAGGRSDVCGIATVDVDGPGAGKHAYGADMFSFYITKTGFYPVGTDGDATFNYTTGCTQAANPTVGSTAAKACTAWVVYNGNMDYKKADSSGKCITNSTKALDFAANTSCD